MGKKKAKIDAPLPQFNQLLAGQQQALQNAFLQNIAANRINQVTPYGSVTYSGDPLTGQTQTLTLSDGAQATLNNQEQLAQTLSGLGVERAGGIDLSAPDLSGLPQRVSSLDLSSLPQLPGVHDQAAERQRIEQELFNRSAALLRPEFARQREQTDQTLADRGFDLERSAAASDEYNRLDSAQNQAYERAASDAVAAAGNEISRNFGLASQARQQGLNEALTQASLANDARAAGLGETLSLRNLPLADLSALAGVAPNLPSLSPAQPYTYTQGPVDYAGLNLSAYDAALAKARMDQAARQAFWNGVTGLAGGIGSLAFGGN